MEIFAPRHCAWTHDGNTPSCNLHPGVICLRLGACVCVMWCAHMPLGNRWGSSSLLPAACAKDSCHPPCPASLCFSPISPFSRRREGRVYQPLGWEHRIVWLDYLSWVMSLVLEISKCTCRGRLLPVGGDTYPAQLRCQRAAGHPPAAHG